MKRLSLLILILSLFLTTQCFAATGWLKTKPASGDNPSTISTTVGENNAALDLMLSTYTNVKLSYASAATLTVSTGGAMVSNSTGATRLMLANTASITADWTMIDTGAEESSTTYYVYAIASATTDTTFTVKVSKSGTAPSGVTYYKRLGSFYNDGSGNITQITNDNDTSAPSYVKGQGNYYKIDSGSGVSGSISFSFTYASAPVVIICKKDTANGMSNPQQWVDTTSTTGFHCYDAENQTGHALYWISIGQVLAQ